MFYNLKHYLLKPQQKPLSLERTAKKEAVSTLYSDSRQPLQPRTMIATLGQASKSIIVFSYVPSPNPFLP
jgi:hypothetical protein